MWKIRKLDEQLFDGAAAKIHEYLDIEPLMPPGRLRLSKSLKRPMMCPLYCDCMARVFLQECRDMDCRISGMHMNDEGRYKRWKGHVSGAPADVDRVYIVSDEDRAFGKAWYDKHGQMWPRIRSTWPHPVLPDLISRDCSKQWREESRMPYWRDFGRPHQGRCQGCDTVMIGGDVQSRPRGVY